MKCQSPPYTFWCNLRLGRQILSSYPSQVSHHNNEIRANNQIKSRTINSIQNTPTSQNQWSKQQILTYFKTNKKKNKCRSNKTRLYTFTEILRSLWGLLNLLTLFLRIFFVNNGTAIFSEVGWGRGWE